MELHPITVHFTIGLFFAGFVFEIAGILLRRPSLRVAGWWNLLATAFAALASILTGRAAEASNPHTDAIHSLMTVHEQWAWWFLAAIILFLALRIFLVGGPPFKESGPSPWKAAGLVLLLAASGILFSGARLGGEMVYGHGMGVVPMMDSMRAGHGHGAEGHDGGHEDHDSGMHGEDDGPEARASEASSHGGHDHSSHSH